MREEVWHFIDSSAANIHWRIRQCTMNLPQSHSSPRVQGRANGRSEDALGSGRGEKASDGHGNDSNGSRAACKIWKLDNERSLWLALVIGLGRKR